MEEKTRILNGRLASIISEMRHGEMLFIGDAGNGTSEKWLYPLDPSVEYLNLSVCTNVPRFKDVVRGLYEAGDFEAAIVAEDMRYVNPEDFGVLVELFGEDHIYEINNAPEMYQMRDRCTAMLQTGDYGKLALCILVAGYSSVEIPLEILTGEKKYTSIPMKDRK